jgi:hypothetical protein
MLITNPKRFKSATVKVWVYRCGCKAGIENSELARNKRFYDACGKHKGVPDPGDVVKVEYHA